MKILATLLCVLTLFQRPTMADDSCTPEALAIISELKHLYYSLQVWRDLNPQLKATTDRLVTIVNSACFDKEKAERENPIWHHYFTKKNNELALNTSELIGKLPERVVFFQEHGDLATSQELFDVLQEVKKIYGWELKIKRPQKAEPKSCTNVDLSKDMPPIRDQAGIPWCESYTYADLLSYKLKENISATYLAMLLDARPMKKKINSQHIKTVNKYYGFCPESVLPSKIYGPEIETILQEVAQYQKKKNASQCQRYAKALFPQSLVAEVASILQKNSFDKIMTLASEFKECSFEQTEAISPLATAVLKICCQYRKKLKIKNLVITKDTSDMTSVVSIVDQALDAKKPALIRYHWGVITNRAEVDQTGEHASSVVGRRFKNGQCQYLVRNSWGETSCTQSVGIKADDYCKPPGHFWVTLETLDKSIYNAEYIADPVRAF